jgi:DtxR family Mn-dependent transcriptional regulator
MIEIRESYKDYLKVIYLISKNKKGGWVSNLEISKFLKVKPASVTQMLYKLRDNDLIDWKPRKLLRLTSTGKDIALKTINNNCVLKEFFVNILKITDLDAVDKICCKIEHHINTDISKALKELISEITD